MDSLEFENSAKGLTFHWKIEHFSCLWHKTGENITSPVFIADSVEKTKWCLWLYPKGDLNETYVACYLQRLPSTKGPNSISINYELSFISENSILQPSVTLEDVFENGQIKGKREFMKQEKFHSHTNLFPKDTLTVICRIWRSIRRNKWRSITNIVTEQTRKTETKEKIERVALFA
ncbi:speckle-type POZ protein B [Trichonephila inaurata madagascariensis]|uniref:Speckle-type POZ protein B n=1 Tax=Trichonephila inaurata madagascariensis TaxID=2747483 RepID=A0A8X6XZ23_9ARAC|nr:speckle-type POZ protein B [Trichonephila inaurata madagascariensis]